MDLSIAVHRTSVDDSRTQSSLINTVQKSIEYW